MSEGFQFKQFYVRHDRCAMKVGTDGVLLGAWTPVLNQQSPITNQQSPFRVLDIGTGSGLIALMLAQRCPSARIDAIDIDVEAVAQAQENFLHSPWSDHLAAYHSSLQDWSIPDHRSPITNPKTYSLIVSNPPYFRNSLKNPDKGREQARHTDSLSYEELIARSADLLATDGQLALILPAETEKEICQLAQAQSLALTRITRVFSKVSKPARRVLLCFAKLPTSHQSPILEDSLVLEDDHGGRSDAYRLLAQDFYL